MTVPEFLMTPERWKQVDELLEKALARDGNDRLAFLDQACAGDAELRRKVEDLLKAHEQRGSFLNSPALETEAKELAKEEAASLLGRKLGNYEILSLLGAGGMGEVYRARDSRLGRDVAIKVLPAAFSADADRLRRFEQEARSAGMLNHPNILTVHDLGTHEGSPYIVSELLEGDTLRERLSGAALAATKTIGYALQIARGLAAAHEKGIVHRDLKPENVFITQDARVKILDFGLAKLKNQPFSGDANTLASTKAMTEAGVVLGTIGYMAPEQARGQEADHRADIFSFGVILYEMLSGKRAFQGGSPVEVLNAILKDEPPGLTETERPIPPGVERLVRRCLEKNPAERFQNASDLAFALEALATSSDPHLADGGVRKPGIAAERIGWRGRPFWIGTTAVLLIATLVVVWLYFRQPPVAASAITFSVFPPEKLAFAFVTKDAPYTVAVSPDGTRLALIAAAEGPTQLWVRPMGALAFQRLAGTDGATYPFWSPDSRFIGFFADGKLKKIEAAGGPPQTLCPAPRWGTTATWNREGVILFSANDGIYRVSAEGGETALMVKPGQLREAHVFWPQFLPDGRHFLFTAGGLSKIGDDLYLGSLDSTAISLLVKDASRSAYIPPGFLLYVRDGTLLAHPFDMRALRLMGQPIPIAEDLSYFKPIGSADFSVSASGEVLAYRLGRNVSRLAWLNRRGVEIGSAGEMKDYSLPRISPDGQSAAVNVSDPRTGTSDIWIYDLASGAPTRFTSEPGMENSPIWSPTGRQIVFAADPDGPPHLHQKALHETGSGAALVPMSGWVQWPYDWTLDGKFILYGDGESKTGDNLMILPMTGKRKATPFLRTQFKEVDARFSADGRWVAYVSDESGRPEVYVRSFPSGTENRQISAAGGTSPRWRRDGKELFFLAADKRLMAVPVQAAGEALKPGMPLSLFRVNARENDYDVTADGERFLINISVVEAKFLPITVTVNWMSSLKKR